MTPRELVDLVKGNAKMYPPGCDVHVLATALGEAWDSLTITSAVVDGLKAERDQLKAAVTASSETTDPQ